MYEDFIEYLNEIFKKEGLDLRTRSYSPSIFGGAAAGGYSFGCFYEKESSRAYTKPHIVLDWPKTDEYRVMDLMICMRDFFVKICPWATVEIREDDKKYSLYVTGLEKSDVSKDLVKYDDLLDLQINLLIVLNKLSRTLLQFSLEDRNHLLRLGQIVPLVIEDLVAKGVYSIEYSAEAEVPEFILKWSLISSGKVFRDLSARFLNDQVSDCALISENDKNAILTVALTPELKALLTNQSRWEMSLKELYREFAQVGSMLVQAQRGFVEAPRLEPTTPVKIRYPE